MLPFASDNTAPVHPDALAAIIEANTGFSPSYGGDPWTEKAQKLIQKTLKTQAKVLFVPTGTGANVLGLKLLCQSHESVLCSDIAHIHASETGATEAFVGCKLLTVPHSNGKVTPELLLKKIHAERAGGKHATLPKILSLTQATEFGTVYTLQELKTLATVCKEEQLLLHIDGCRLYNAAAHLKISLQEFVHTFPIDILSLGGSKNGLMYAEAIVIFNPQLQERSDFLQKQTLQLFSKMRFLSAQYIPFFQNNLWHTLAHHANMQAHKLATLLAKNNTLQISYPVETNQIFFTAPPALIPLIQQQIACHLWDYEKHQLRLVTSWCTTDQDVIAAGKVLNAV